MKVNIATIFDKNYVIRTMAFYDALARLGEYMYWFLCIDAESKSLIERMKLENVRIFTLDDLDDPELLATRSGRSVPEFVFTAKPAFLSYIAGKIPEAEGLVFADNDVIFFKRPEMVLEGMHKENKSIGINPHRFPKKKDYMNARVGRYNAGLQFYIIDGNSRKCLEEWRRDCIEWCFLIYEPTRFGDQKYIDYWPDKYEGVSVLPQKGVNLARWNISNWRITNRHGEFFVDDEPLICYHFHRIRYYLSNGRIRPMPIYIVHEELYKIYLRMLERARNRILKVEPNWSYGFVPKPNPLRLIKQNIQRVWRKFLISFDYK